MKLKKFKKGRSNIYVAPLLPRSSLATLAKRIRVFRAQIFSEKTSREIT
jgi:hypothetical protein